MNQAAVPCTILRGGTSKGSFFLKSDLPADDATRDAALLAVRDGKGVAQREPVLTASEN